jgi:hypothetical protein
MENTLFIVIESMDGGRKGGHEVIVHGCFLDRNKALLCMEREAKKLQERLEADLKQGDDWFNVIDGETYFVFEIKESHVTI